MSTPFSIPVATHPAVNLKDGKFDRTWYRFLNLLFGVTGAGQINLSTLPGTLGGVETLALDAYLPRNQEGEIAELKRRLSDLENYVASREI